jgi:hypothetical protein
VTPVAVPLRRNLDFTLLWSGQVVSTLGSEVGGLAFPLLVLAGILLVLAVAGTASADIRRAPRPEELLAARAATEP